MSEPTKEPSDAAKAFVRDCREAHLWPNTLQAPDMMRLFDAHMEKLLQRDWNTHPTVEGLARLLHELGIPDADIEQASAHVTELRAEARRSAALRERVAELERAESEQDNLQFGVEDCHQACPTPTEEGR